MLVRPPPARPGEITITQKIAEEVNRTAGKEIIYPEDVGKTIFVGIPGDGHVTIKTTKNEPRGHMYGLGRKFISTDGRVSIADGSVQFWETGESTSIFGIASIEPEKALLIIGALFGPEEIGQELTEAQRAQIAGLHTAMGLE